ncbi:hypothetical protein Gpo141_00000129 [Globisporangium polare]
MVPDLLRVVPLKLHVRNATQTNGEAPVYELFCRWRNEAKKPGDSFTYSEWSVWKTFEGFQALDAKLRAQRPHCKFAKMMVTVAFAPEHKVRMFFHQDQTARFLEKRQKELDYYMQRILLFPGVGEFVAGTGSRVLAEFLDADKHVDCSKLQLLAFDVTSSSVSLSPTSLLLEQHSQAETGSGVMLRTLNVDMHAAFSPSHSYASSSATTNSFDKHRGGPVGPAMSSRKVIKQEIEDELALRFGEHQLKRFRKRARAFRKENDPTVAVQDFIKYVAAEYDAEFASWLLPRFLKTVKPEDKKVALREACGDALLNERDDAASRKARKDELKKMQRAASAQSMTSSSNNSPAGSSSSASAKLSRKKSSKEILSRVEKYARGNAEHVESFKVAAKALGNQEMTTAQFVSFVRATFGRADAQEILYLVVDVVPLPHVQRELREVLAI